MPERPDKYKLIGKLAVPCGDLLEWARWLETAERHVARTEIGPLVVSTVFLGLDHSSGGEGDPILFETMIFGAEPEFFKERWQTRCSTWGEAERMHAEAVAHARQQVEQADAALNERHTGIERDGTADAG